MAEENEETLSCSNCDAEIKSDDEFCPECGELFIEEAFCSQHPSKAATGVCIVCALPFCPDCGGRVQNRFLCHDHEMLEIYEGMARVFGSSDSVQIEFAKSELETAGLHPFVYSRKSNSTSSGGPDYTLFRAGGEYDGHVVNEFKLMLPCQEFVSAQEKLRELEFVK
jgi:hypothetical protein